MVKEISDKEIEKTINDFLDFFQEKRKKKGNLCFNSPLEGYGKMAEECYEILKALHEKNWKNFNDECFDVMVVLMWTIISNKANGLK